MTVRTARWLAVLPLCWAVTGAWAHHSLAGYNTAVYMTIDGVVKSFTWSNPHVQLVLVVADAAGTVKQWPFDGPSISRLASNGFSRSMVAPGDKITVEYNPKRGGGIGGLMSGITTADGKNRNIARLHEPKP